MTEEKFADKSMTSKRNTVLIIEDEPPIRKLYGISLEGAGFKSMECGSGAEGLRLAASTRPDLILLDLGLPDMDGKDVITHLREWSQIPIIVCSVRSNDDEIIRALEVGADDYMTKPFNPEVLLARIQANLRKAATQQAGEPELLNGSIRMDLVRHEVFVNGEKTVFTPKEYDLLRYFLLHRGKMLTHKQILQDVWGPAHLDDMQYLRVYVSQLREKIEETPSSPRYIVTEPAIGYRMEVFADDDAADDNTKGPLH